MRRSLITELVNVLHPAVRSPAPPQAPPNHRPQRPQPAPATPRCPLSARIALPTHPPTCQTSPGPPTHLPDVSLPGSVHTLSATPRVPWAAAALEAMAATSWREAPLAAAAPAICLAVGKRWRGCRKGEKLVRGRCGIGKREVPLAAAAPAICAAGDRWTEVQGWWETGERGTPLAAAAPAISFYGQGHKEWDRSQVGYWLKVGALLAAAALVTWQHWPEGKQMEMGTGQVKDWQEEPPLVAAAPAIQKAETDTQSETDGRWGIGGRGVRCWHRHRRCKERTGTHRVRYRAGGEWVQGYALPAAAALAAG